MTRSSAAHHAESLVHGQLGDRQDRGEGSELLLRLMWTAGIGRSPPPPLPELRRMLMLPERERTFLSRDAKDRGLRERLSNVGERLDELAAALCGAAGVRVALGERMEGRETENVDGPTFVVAPGCYTSTVHSERDGKTGSVYFEYLSRDT